MSNDNLEKIHSLEIKVTRIDAYFRTILAIAVIFGLSGAWGLKVLKSSNDKIKNIQVGLGGLESRINKAEENLSHVDVALTESIKKEIETYVEKIRVNLKRNIEEVSGEKIIVSGLQQLDEANALYDSQQWDLAILAYQKIISKDKDPDNVAFALYRQGNCFLYLADTETAKIIFKKVMADYPTTKYARLSKEQLN